MKPVKDLLARIILKWTSVSGNPLHPISLIRNILLFGHINKKRLPQNIGTAFINSKIKSDTSFNSSFQFLKQLPELQHKCVVAIRPGPGRTTLEIQTTDLSA